MIPEIRAEAIAQVESDDEHRHALEVRDFLDEQSRILSALGIRVERLPMIQNVYRLVKKLISALQQKPENVQQVVLIEFPSPEMKTVGFVTRTMLDKHSGKELAAVYVPTTPNPTSGDLEIVPIDKLVSTDWSIDEAMNFIISGGAVAPEHVPYTKQGTD